MKILYFINHKPFFVSHRLPIAVAMMNKGHSVYLLSGKSNDKKMEKYANKQIKKKNINSKSLNFNSSSLNILNFLTTLFLSIKYIKNLNPDLIHSASMKTNIISGLCALILSKPVVIAFSGFGYVFTDQKGLKKSLIRVVIKLLFKLIFLNSEKHIIVQNSFDKKYLLKYFDIRSKDISRLNGSGVFINKKKIKIKKNNTIIFPSRVLIHKGILEFISAAKILKKKYKNWRFLVIGSNKGDNPTTLKEQFIKKSKKKKIITFIDYKEKLDSFYLRCNIVCLPTYREGLPKSLIEACNFSVPIVTTNIPGCELVVKNNYNGFKVPIKNSIDLARKLEILINSEKLRKKFGENSYKLAKKYFDINTIIEKHYLIYKKIYNG